MKNSRHLSHLRLIIPHSLGFAWSNFFSPIIQPTNNKWRTTRTVFSFVFNQGGINVKAGFKQEKLGQTHNCHWSDSNWAFDVSGMQVCDRPPSPQPKSTTQHRCWTSWQMNEYLVSCHFGCTRTVKSVKMYLKWQRSNNNNLFQDVRFFQMSFNIFY